MTGTALRVDADLRFAVADGDRRATGSVTADGDTITVNVDRPWAALRVLQTAALPVGGGRTAAAPVADALSGAGLRLAVVGPNGPLLTLGRGVHSAVGRRFAGSARIAVRPGALLAPQSTRSAIAVGALLAMALVGRRLLGRRRAGDSAAG